MRPALIVFAVAAAAQWLLPLWGVWRHERVIARGTVVRIECGAPDPYDPLRGRYLAVRPLESGFAPPEGMPEGERVPVWATLAVGADGLARIESLTLEPVSGPTVVQLAARSPRSDRNREAVIIEWPFDRFYLNERLAPDADRLLAERLAEDTRPVAEVCLLEGRAVLTDVLIDGVSIREIVGQPRK